MPTTQGLIVVTWLLLGTPHSNLAGRGCEILVGWYPPSGGNSKQLLLATPHLGVQGGGASKDLEYQAARRRRRLIPTPNRSCDSRVASSAICDPWAALFGFRTRELVSARCEWRTAGHTQAVTPAKARRGSKAKTFGSNVQ